MVKNQAFRAKNSDLDIVFINAWNEWAEDCHLEPDMKFGYQWLEAVSTVQQLAKEMQIDTCQDRVEHLKVGSKITKRYHVYMVNKKVVLIFHVFYIDVFRDIFESVRQMVRLLLSSA